MRSVALVLTFTLLAPLPARAQQPTFNPATFDWTDPANWSTRIDPSGVQKWTLRDPAARAYHNQAVQTGQFCVASFRRGSRNVNLMIPKISPECQRRGG
jgi:hypothetical protein